MGMSKDRKKMAMEYTADALGMKLSKGGNVKDRVAVAGPMNVLSVPLQMRYSHGNAPTAASYLVNCWKVVGNLYISVACVSVAGGFDVYVILMDKARWAGEKNFVTTFANAEMKGHVDTIRDYLAMMHSAVVGVWKKPSPMSPDYVAIEDWESKFELLENMDQRKA